MATVLFYLGTKDLVGGETAFPKVRPSAGPWATAQGCLRCEQAQMRGGGLQESEWIGEAYGRSLGPYSECAEGHVAMKPRKGAPPAALLLLGRALQEAAGWREAPAS